MKILKMNFFFRRKITKMLLQKLENFRKVPRNDCSRPIYCFSKTKLRENGHLYSFHLCFQFFEECFVSCLATNFFSYTPAGNYMFKFNNRICRKSCKICSKLTVKTPERRQFWHLFVNFEHISHHLLIARLGNCQLLEQVTVHWDMETFHNIF